MISQWFSWFRTFAFVDALIFRWKTWFLFWWIRYHSSKQKWRFPPENFPMENAKIFPLALKDYTTRFREAIFFLAVFLHVWVPAAVTFPRAASIVLVFTRLLCWRRFPCFKGLKEKTIKKFDTRSWFIIKFVIEHGGAVLKGACLLVSPSFKMYHSFVFFFWK